jgi:hypothetical protein
MQARRVHEIVWIDGSKLNVNDSGSYVLTPGVQSGKVVVFGQSGCVSENVLMSSPKISMWRGCLPQDTGFFRTAAQLDLGGDHVHFCARAQRDPRVKSPVGDEVEAESEDETPSVSLEGRMTIALKSLADPAQIAVLATTAFFQRSSMTAGRMLNALVEGEKSDLASKGWNASAIGSKVLGVDSFYWAQPTNKVRVKLSEEVQAKITQWLKESKHSGSKLSNYEVQERILSGRDRDWELRALVTVGRVTRLIAAGLKTAGEGGKKRKSPSTGSQHVEGTDEAQPSKRQARTSKAQNAKEIIRGSKRAEPSTPASGASVPKVKKTKHSWSFEPAVSASAEPASSVCEGSRTRKANPKFQR